MALVAEYAFLDKEWDPVTDSIAEVQQWWKGGHTFTLDLMDDRRHRLRSHITSELCSHCCSRAMLVMRTSGHGANRWRVEFRASCARQLDDRAQRDSALRRKGVGAIAVYREWLLSVLQDEHRLHPANARRGQRPRRDLHERVQAFPTCFRAPPPQAMFDAIGDRCERCSRGGRAMLAGVRAPITQRTSGSGRRGPRVQ